MNSEAKKDPAFQKIFSSGEAHFDELCMESFLFQYRHHPLYQRYCSLMQVRPEQVSRPEQIPFLPISFFKTHTVCLGEIPASPIFESSGTTGETRSRHAIPHPEWYRESYSRGFRLFYGNPSDYRILCLVPEYRTKPESSLACMCAGLIEQSGHPESGFYLNDQQRLQQTLVELEQKQLPVILIGITYALVEFAERFPVPLKSTIVMETGGMKGRRKELTRPEVHNLLEEAFARTTIHSEYGMTELLSQAYSRSGGIFNSPPWMRILIREETDPRNITYKAKVPVRGAVNIIDLANRFSCPFIATDDAGILHPDGSFEILGRMDNADIRGCSLMSF